MSTITITNERETLELIIKKITGIGDLLYEDIVMIARKGLATGNAETDFEYWPDSSTIAWAEYHPKRQALYIMFRTRKLYQYDLFPSDEWQKMKRCESVGKFFNTTVKQYQSREVEAL